MAPSHQKGPDLKRFMDKKLRLTLNGNRKVVGTLRGFDAFLNVVLEEAIDEHHQSSGGGGGGENSDDPSSNYLGQIVIRGNSIVQFETLERL
mmetsp:Transcript_5056/g.5901  ORF Transcript_5056/g.5901 Transcript_5056/m.5901 type:complete len:92 (+) Transcript_5056:134-409(+)|eukprot:CAMPEP_0198248584 /NCGR_PEP_ID=MMETSP1447-20131203/335_1 /TAXON_ID=420782 /ORGANISM="Chaetoceros dichaeta, Strain CCMP1751" /LENGTH=91 /DNA_ID=CAMNT_0043933025 /DNA_START=130 /DNA_END=405 /DNA_ORIENTATION=+